MVKKVIGNAEDDLPERWMGAWEDIDESRDDGTGEREER